MKRFAACVLATISLVAAVCFLFPRGSHRVSSKAANQARQVETTIPANSNRTAAKTGSVAEQMPPTPSGTGSAQAPAPPKSSAQARNTAPRKRPWDPEFLASLREVNEGDPLRFELLEGEWASGTIQFLERKNGELLRISGKLTG